MGFAGRTWWHCEPNWGAVPAVTPVSSPLCPPDTVSERFCRFGIV
jgi:hypothetical protein